MKELLLGVTLAAGTLGPFGQGVVNINTVYVNSYLRYSNTVASAWAMPNSFYAGLYWSYNSNTLASGGGTLAANGGTNGTGLATFVTAGGYIAGISFGGIRAILDGESPVTTPIFVQLRAWSSNYTDYASAAASGNTNVLITPLIGAGAAPIVGVTPSSGGPPPGPPGQIIWAPGTSSSSPLVVNLVPVPQSSWPLPIARCATNRIIPLSTNCSTVDISALAGEIVTDPPGLPVVQNPVVVGVGTTSVSFAADDGAGHSATCYASITVTAAGPGAASYAVAANLNEFTRIAVGKILAKCSSPEGRALDLISVISPGNNGGVATLAGGTITYSNNVDVGDSFKFVIQDCAGLKATGSVVVTFNNSSTNYHVSITQSNAPGGGETITVLKSVGIPLRVYDILRSGGINGPVWDVLATIQAAQNGSVLYLHTNAPSPSYYRARLHPQP